jgi:hypothetical protein
LSEYSDGQPCKQKCCFCILDSALPTGSQTAVRVDYAETPSNKDEWTKADTPTVSPALKIGIAGSRVLIHGASYLGMTA